MNNSKGIFEQMQEGCKHTYIHNKELTLEGLKEIFNKYLFNKSERRTIMHTGIGGYYSYKFALAMTTGVITLDMVIKHAKLIHKNQFRKTCIDINNIVWMYDIIKGKLYWICLQQYQQPTVKKDPKESRFNKWEKMLKEKYEE